MINHVGEALRSSSAAAWAASSREALAANALVGALDSACNRTCAGESWIQGYLQKLSEAPQEIRDLVVGRDEGELQVRQWRHPPFQ